MLSKLATTALFVSSTLALGREITGKGKIQAIKNPEWPWLPEDPQNHVAGCLRSDGLLIAPDGDCGTFEGRDQGVYNDNGECGASEYFWDDPQYPQTFDFFRCQTEPLTFSGLKLAIDNDTGPKYMTFNPLSSGQTWSADGVPDEEGGEWNVTYSVQYKHNYFLLWVPDGE